MKLWRIIFTLRVSVGKLGGTLSATPFLVDQKHSIPSKVISIEYWPLEAFRADPTPAFSSCWLYPNVVVAYSNDALD